MSAQERYRRDHIRKDKRRLVQALRGEANRVEANLRPVAVAWRDALRRSGDASDIAVTDHAVIRFLERVMGIDVDAIRRQIARLIPAAAVPMPTSDTPDVHGLLLVEDYQFLLTPTTLISVLSEDMSPTTWLGLPSRDDFGDTAA